MPENEGMLEGGTLTHCLIAGNICGELRNRLRGTPCRVYQSDVKVLAGENYYYPDAVVHCQRIDLNSLFVPDPILIVEVLSDSTRERDMTDKLAAYTALPSLQEYLLVSQQVAHVIHHRRDPEGQWRQHVHIDRDGTGLDGHHPAARRDLRRGLGVIHCRQACRICLLSRHAASWLHETPRLIFNRLRHHR